MPRLNVRFDYFYIESVYNEKNIIDITSILECFKKFSPEEKTMGFVQGNKIKILKINFFERYTYKKIETDTVKTVTYPFWYIIFTRSRPDLPGILKHDATDLVPLELDDDEYISENTVMIYDATKGIILLQRNLTGTPPKAVQTMFNSHITNDNEQIILSPILDESALNRANKQFYHKAINFRVANVSQTLTEVNDESLLKDIMKSSLKLSEMPSAPLQVEVSIKIPGRDRNHSLNDPEIRCTINELDTLREKNLIDKLQVKGATDEAAQIEEIDLMKEVLRGKVCFETDESRFIDSDKIMEKILQDYSSNRYQFKDIL